MSAITFVKLKDGGWAIHVPAGDGVGIGVASIAAYSRLEVLGDSSPSSPSQVKVRS